MAGYLETRDCLRKTVEKIKSNSDKAGEYIDNAFSENDEDEK